MLSQNDPPRPQIWPYSHLWFSTVLWRRPSTHLDGFLPMAYSPSLHLLVLALQKGLEHPTRAHHAHSPHILSGSFSPCWVVLVNPFSHLVQSLFLFTLCLIPSHTLKWGLACICLHCFRHLWKARTESDLPSHQTPSSAMKKPDPFPWPELGSYKDRTHDVPTLGLPLFNLLTSHVPEIIPLVRGVKSLCLLSLLPKD